MKTTAKILILFVTLLLGEIINAQPCTPDTNFPGKQGTLPEALERSIVNTPYSAVIQFKAPADTTATVGGQNIVVTVDSLRITQVIGLPAGYSYECHNANCMVLGGGVGCAKITGTPLPNQTGTYPLKVVVKLRGKFPLFGIPVQIPESLQYDTNFRYSIVIGYNTGLRQWQTSPPMVVYPNPANTEVNIELGSAIKEDGIIRIMDLNGRVVRTEKLSAYQTKIQTADLSKGMYMLEVQAIQGTYHSRIRIE